MFQLCNQLNEMLKTSEQTEEKINCIHKQRYDLLFAYSLLFQHFLISIIIVCCYLMFTHYLNAKIMNYFCVFSLDAQLWTFSNDYSHTIFYYICRRKNQKTNEKKIYKRRFIFTLLQNEQYLIIKWNGSRALWFFIYLQSFPFYSFWLYCLV